jgi:hypothetical protein
VLAFSSALERSQPIARRHGQVPQFCHRVQSWMVARNRCDSSA